MRPTIYASAASCRHIMVLPWKCKSYLPTLRAISKTNCEKGSFLIRSSVLFGTTRSPKEQLCQASTSWSSLPYQPRGIPSGGALPPTVGQSFLLTGSFLPKSDGPSSAAIWANCQVGNDDSDLPTSSSNLASSTHLSVSSNLYSSSLTGEGFLAGDG